MKTLPIRNPRPDYHWFSRVIRGQEMPKRPPFVELFLDQEVLQEVAEAYLDLRWVPLTADKEVRKKYWNNYMEVYRRLGYDFVWIDGRVNFPQVSRTTTDTADLSRGMRRWDEESAGAITSWEDYEKYAWPSATSFDLWDIEYVSKNLPEGMGMFVFPCRGFLEVPLEIIFGYENFALLMYDEPELIRTVCERVRQVLLGFYSSVVGADKLMGFFPGDDMGFRSATLISPAALRELILPGHKLAAEIAHKHGLLYMLHSCGQLEAIMEDLIEDVKIDAKHSFEDSITPVADFQMKYGDRIAVLGGVDVDKLCRLPESDLREYVRGILEACVPRGRYALGTGNSVANYIPIGNYLAMLEEGWNYSR